MRRTSSTSTPEACASGPASPLVDRGAALPVPLDAIVEGYGGTPGVGFIGPTGSWMSQCTPDASRRHYYRGPDGDSIFSISSRPSSLQRETVGRSRPLTCSWSNPACHQRYLPGGVPRSLRVPPNHELPLV